jgi:ATPase subunit of ABC transporter with duplicated ATPase domains
MISLNNVNYEKNGKEIINNVSFSINSGEKIGLVGPNGAGKTTLLKLINGDITPTSGDIIRTNEEIGMLPQDMRAWFDHTVYGFIEEVTGVKEVREQFDRQCASLENFESERTLLLYADALERYDKFEVASFESNLEKALKRADIAMIDTDKEIGKFSGGQRTRIALAAVFASRYDVVLLDEPTNNLDDSGVVVLEKFIEGSKAAFLMVSHDRRFLRNATSRIIELMGGDQGVKQFGLGYDEYIEARENAKQATFKRYEQFEKEKKRLQKASRAARVKANSAGSNSSYSDNDKLTSHFRKEKAANGLASAAVSISSRLDHLEEPERPEEDVSLKFGFNNEIEKRINLLSVSNLEVDYGDCHKIGPISFSIRSGERVLLKGKNGSGKTSIIRGILGVNEMSMGDVYLSRQANTVYIDQNQTLPLIDGSALANLRELSPSLELHDAINLLIKFGLKKDILSTIPSRALSGGERAKILLASISAQNSGLLILDEPTNNLDIPAIEALENALLNYPGGILLVSHDRDFVNNIGVTNSIDISD